MRVQVICAVLFTSTLLARDHTDIIVMQNGDRITGEIKSLEAGVLKIDVAYVDGAISVQWSKVARIESKQPFIIHTEDGSVYTGALGTPAAPDAGQSITLLVAEGNESVVVEKAKVVKLGETSQQFFQSLSGAINLGLVYAKGNNATQYNLGADVEYRQERWGFEGSLSSNLSANSGSNTATHNQLSLATYRLMGRKNYFYSAFGGVLQSSAQGIDAQTSLGFGVGRYFKNTNRVRISVLGGFIWYSGRYQPSVAPIPTEQVYGGAIVTDLSIFLFKKTNLSARTIVAPAFSDPGRVFVNTNVSYYLKLFSNLSWNLSFYGNWDTKPPGTLSGSDYGYSSGIAWTFGYK
jgi:hypothetical protein